MKKLIRLELRKIFSKRLTLLALAAVLLLSAFLAFSTYQNKYASDDAGYEGTGRTAVEIDKAVAERYSGVLTDEKVQRMISEIVPKSGENGLNAIYLYQNTIQSAVSARFSDRYGNWNGLRVSDVFGDENIKIGYVDGWLSTSQNMTRVLVIFLFFIIVMIAPVFCGEYNGVEWGNDIPYGYHEYIQEDRKQEVSTGISCSDLLKTFCKTVWYLCVPGSFFVQKISSRKAGRV